LIERNGRELPIQPDIIGESLELSKDQQIKLVNNAGLQLEYRTKGVVNEE
jgi:pyrimidine operon attenuation protein/uracil phosphoribosyltransferase